MSFKDGNRDEEDVQIFMDSWTLAELAQLVEHQTFTLRAMGSSPISDLQ